MSSGNRLLLISVLFSVVGLFPVSDVSLNGRACLPFAASHFMVLYQCLLIFGGVVVFFLVKFLFVRSHKTTNFFYGTAFLAVTAILLFSNFLHTHDSFNVSLQYWPANLWLGDCFRFNNVLAYGLLGFLGICSARLKQHDSVSAGYVIQIIIFGGMIWFFQCRDYPYLLLFMALSFYLLLELAPDLSTAAVVVFLFMCIALLIVSFSSGSSKYKWAAIYYYENQTKWGGYQTAQILRDIEKGGVFGRGPWHYQPEEDLGWKVLLDGTMKFTPQLLGYEFGVVALPGLLLLIAGMFWVFRRAAKQMADEEMIKILDLSILFVILPMVFIILRTYNLVLLMPSYSFPLMGYGVDAVLVNYAVMGVAAGTIEKDRKKRVGKILQPE